MAAVAICPCAACPLATTPSPRAASVNQFAGLLIEPTTAEGIAAIAEAPMWIVLMLACQQQIASMRTDQPFGPHELVVNVTLGQPADVAVMCRDLDDPAETHLVESATQQRVHRLEIGGLRASTAYRCTAQIPEAPDVSPITVDVATRAPDAPLPVLEIDTYEPEAGSEYVLLNHGKMHPQHAPDAADRRSTRDCPVERPHRSVPGAGHRVRPCRG